ncbi:MAG: hypothetical protein KAT33_04905 [Bacteroidales bacterium]|nr:hypothetical protein [Bacteroidales bacterium]
MKYEVIFAKQKIISQGRYFGACHPYGQVLLFLEKALNAYFIDRTN